MSLRAIGHTAEEIRRAALEEAARICDQPKSIQEALIGAPGWPDSWKLAKWPVAKSAEECAAGIRRLIEGVKEQR